MGVLTTRRRQALPESDFAVPQRRAYPIDTRARARNALARVAQHGSNLEKHLVRTAVHARYPGIEVSGLPESRRNPGPFGLPDIGTLAVLGVALWLVTRDWGKKAGDILRAGGEAVIYRVNDLIGRSNEWQFANISYPGFLRGGAALQVSYVLNHRGPANSVLTGMYLNTLGPGEIWDNNTIVMVGDDANWVGYPVRLYGVIGGTGVYTPHFYVRQQATYMADEVRSNILVAF